MGAVKRRRIGEDGARAQVSGSHDDVTVWQIYDEIRAQVAKNSISMRDSLTLLGILRNMGIDDLLLDVLPKVLSRRPTDRGDFGKIAVDQLDAAVKLKRSK